MAQPLTSGMTKAGLLPAAIGGACLLGSADRSYPRADDDSAGIGRRDSPPAGTGATDLSIPVRAAVSGHQAGEASTPDGLRGRLEGDQSHQEEGERRPGRR
jgi:hypothetical protein